MKKLEGKKIAVLVTDGFEQSELTEPVKAIKSEGGQIDIIAPDRKKVKSWNKGKWGREFEVDKTLAEANPDEYDGLLLPGGVMNPDQLRKNSHAVNFVKGFFDESNPRPVGAICHGPWTLINAGVVQGRNLTAWPSLEQDLVNAGAQWHDKEVVVDKGLVTSRQPDDLPAFNQKIVEKLSEGMH